MAMLEDLGGRLMRKASFALIAGLLALAALGVALSALYLWMLLLVAPPAALVIVAGVLLFLALLTWRFGSRRQPARVVQESPLPSLAAALPDAADMIRRAVAADPKSAILGAFAAGYVADNTSSMDLAVLNRIFSQMPR